MSVKELTCFLIFLPLFLTNVSTYTTSDMVDEVISEGNETPYYYDTPEPQENTCEKVCACKWKNGKQTVECVNKGLLEIPVIDSTTQVLDMSGNNLQVLSDGQFARANLLDLQRLYLRRCRLGDIEPASLKGLTNLVELDLSHNILINIPSDALSYVPSLRDLNLGTNQIQKIGPTAFQNTPSLHKLDLSNCGIHTISSNAFEGIDVLNTLKINGNKLTEIRSRTLESLDHLHNIELYNNPWICDCRMRATKMWLVQKNIPYTVPPKCSGGPDRVLERSFAQLLLDEFACPPVFQPMKRDVQSYLSENAVMDCRASAVPTPNIRWYWNGRQLTNGSLFNRDQRSFMFENGQFDRRSRLVLTNSQDFDQGEPEIYCVVENKAGAIETNFTLTVFERPSGFATLDLSQLIGLTTAVVLILVIIFGYMCFRVRMNSRRHIDSKTPRLEVVTSLNQNTYNMGKTGSIAGIVIANSGAKNSNLDRRDSSKYTDIKPDKMTSPTESLSNNPDLINDTKRLEADEFADLKIPACLTVENNYATNFSKTLPRKQIVQQTVAQNQYYHTLSHRGQHHSPKNLDTNSKTIRVWQKGVMPVLPPVTALKRNFNSNCSPDEGYQEGYATDV